MFHYGLSVLKKNFFYLLYTFLPFVVKQQKRVALLMTAGLFEGASIGPLIDLAIEIDPRYVYIMYIW